MPERVIGTGAAFPENRLSNQRLEQMVDTSDAWIRSRTGIRNRFLVEKETVASLAAAAAERAVEMAGIDPVEIDQIIVATSSSEQLFPGTACAVQAEIGASRAGCFDLNAACSGFITAYQLAAAQMRAGMTTTVLIIGAEALSHLVDYEDRGTCILFGDGAGAVLLRREPGEGSPTAFLLGADGTQGSALTCSSGIPAKNKPYGDHIRMDGRAIYQFAVRKVPECIQEVLTGADLSAEDIDLYILHQANCRIIDSIARHLQQPPEKFPMNLQETGNMSSASIPVLLDQLNRDGTLKRGMKLVMAGFGAGLTWGAVCMEW